MWYRFVLAGRKEIEQRFGKETYETVKEIPSNLQEPAAAFVKLLDIKKEQIEEVFKDVANLANRNYISVAHKKNQILLKSKNNEHVFNIDDPEAFLKFSEKIDFYKTLLMPGNLKPQTQTKSLNIPDGTITVIKANNVIDAIQLGSGTTWCISQPKNTMYQSYRSLKASTFYFVFDTTKPEGDPLRRVVVDVTRNGIELTDLENHTGYIKEFRNDYHAYMEYLKSKGVDIGQFKNDPYTKKEQEEYELLTNRAITLDDFISLGSRAKAKNIDDVYSKYIGFGNMLSSDQLKFLIENNAKRLVDQYLNTGNPIHKADLPLLDNQQTRTYLRRRNMMYDYYKDQDGADQMLLYLKDDQFIDEVFFENLLKDGASKVFLLKKLAELNYKYNGYDSLIDRLLNENLTQKELNNITRHLLYIGNIEILDKFFNLHPEQLQMLEDENLLLRRSIAANHNLVHYLYHKINKPQLFVEPALKAMVLDKNYEGYINDLIDDGYADELMKLLLSWNYDLIPQIDYLLNNGASLENAWNILENAWNIASTQYGVKVLNDSHIYKLMKEKHPEYIEEWTKEKHPEYIEEWTKEEDPTLSPKFDPEEMAMAKYFEEYINKFEPQNKPDADETSDPPKDTLAFNLNKFLGKSAKNFN